LEAFTPWEEGKILEKRSEKGWYVAAAASSMSLESRKSQP
jgi:hypothetical protein